GRAARGRRAHRLARDCRCPQSREGSMNVNDKVQSSDNFTPARDVAPLFVEAHHARIICLPSGRKLYMACSGTDAEAEFDDIAMVLDAINRLPQLLAPFGE